MAFLVFADGKSKTVSAEQGKRAWDLLCGHDEPEEKEVRYLNNIKRVFLNWRTAPDEYLLQQDKTNLAQALLNEWMWKKETGYLTRPEPDDHANRRVSELLGLLENDNPTKEAYRIMKLMGFPKGAQPLKNTEDIARKDWND